MKVLIIDDDLAFVTEARMNLEKLGVKYTKYETSEAGAKAAMLDYHPDIVICDINLHGKNRGTSLSKYMSSRDIPFIIVTQSRDDNIYEDIVQYQPLAYFTKPLDYTAVKYTLKKLGKDKIIVPSGGDLFSDVNGSYIFIRKSSKYEKVNFSDVYFIQAEGNYVTFHCITKKYVVRSSLRRCIERISSNYFIQIHRNFIVNIHRIKSFDSVQNTIEVNGAVLPVGRSYKALLKKKLPLIQ